jgi:lathosterol oxidase
MEFTKLTLLFSVIQFFRYILFAGSAYLFFWKWNNPLTKKYRIQQKDFKSEDLVREFKTSIVTSFIFGIVLAISFYNQRNQLFNLQTPSNLKQFWGWLIFLVLFHDTYFYWMHRLIHHPKLFNLVHKTHHLSKNPSPFAALSFHPIESFLEVAWTIPMARLLPMFTWFIFAFLIVIINVLGHLGVEIYPDFLRKNQITKYLNFSKDHNDHHNYFHGNYGLYFSFWDRIMKTYRNP